MKATRTWLLCLLLTLPAIADDFKSFGRDSRATIERSHAGKPLVLIFWSVDCAYCGEEINHLSALSKKRGDIGLVLVNTDGPELADQAKFFLNKNFPGIRAERWIFSGEDPSRLYFSVDKKWQGELPRAYFYNGTGNVRTIAGKVEPRWLDTWSQETRAK